MNTQTLISILANWMNGIRNIETYDDMIKTYQSALKNDRSSPYFNAAEEIYKFITANDEHCLKFAKMRSKESIEWGSCKGCGRHELSCRCGAPSWAY